MNLSTSGKTLIEGFEGKNLYVYGDVAGYPTVGIGHLLSKTVYSNYKNKNLPTADANKELKNAGLDYTSPITEKQSTTLFTNDIAKAVNSVNALSCISKLTQQQFDALVSLTFNVPSSLASNDMTALLADSRTFEGLEGTIQDPAGMRAKVTAAFQYTLSGGVRIAGLVDRRNSEMDLFCMNKKYSYNKIPY